jgi:D-hexose-6-phosphate mutarotase
MITQGENELGLRYVDIATDLCTARLWLHGAHLTSWRPSGQREDVLFMSPDSNFKPNSAIRGGIPLCWPWFGKVNAPSHGVARISPWSLDHVHEDAGNVQLELSLQPDDTNLPEAKLSVRLGRELSMSLTTKARTSYDLSLAFHNYFNVSDVRNIVALGLDSERFQDFVPYSSSPSSELIINAAMDRMYSMQSADGSVVLRDPSFQRDIIINRTSAQSVIVWNPWEEATLAMGDLTNGSWQNFLCIETANAADHHMVLEAGQSVTMSQLIQVRPYNG